ncbi:hypothetical protein [Variovorax ginsengisoli]|uniref:Uncharacterized protein n=1 Tax=Variovorax ginsengisoli TaxID=363844 RepID=A0ABT9SBI5_9BURK|nr:hypothetical protein [Variovorax ginsengisoli]
MGRPAWRKASPGKNSYATSGVGTVLHLAMELLKQRSGIFAPAVRAKLQDQGRLRGNGSAEDLGRFAQAEYARNQKIVQGVHFKE